MLLSIFLGGLLLRNEIRLIKIIDVKIKCMMVVNSGE